MMFVWDHYKDKNTIEYRSFIINETILRNKTQIKKGCPMTLPIEGFRNIMSTQNKSIILS